MVSPATQPVTTPRHSHARHALARPFYTGAAALLLVLMFWGFARFFLHGRAYPDRELAPPIRTLLICHAITMTAWMFLFFIQPLLIMKGNRRVHMLLGRIGAVLAVAIVILGFRVGVEATRIAPPDISIWGLSPKQFMAVPLVSIALFAVFVAVGVWQRRRPQVHRPMMLLAALAAMPAAVSRIDRLSHLYQGTVWELIFGPFFMTLVVGALLVVIHSVLTRSVDRWLVIGFACLALVDAMIMQLATTEPWDQFAGFVLG